MGGKIIKTQKQEIGKNIKPTQDRYANIDYPIFCFKYLHHDYHVNMCIQEDQINFLERLCKLSGMTWLEIQNANKHGLGSEKISRGSIKASIPSSITEDVEHFLALRFSGKKPFVGYRNGSIFHVIYLDRDFTLYKH